MKIAVIIPKQEDSITISREWDEEHQSNYKWHFQIDTSPEQRAYEASIPTKDIEEIPF